MRSNLNLIWPVATVNGKPAGLIGVAEVLKDATAEAVRQRHEEGLQIVLLTGDSQATAEQGGAEVMPLHEVSFYLPCM